MIHNGQPVNADTDNAAFMSRTADTNTTGKVDLKNDDAESGAHITNVQKTINDNKASADATQTQLDNHESSTSAHSADHITYNNTNSGLSATNEQAAIDEIEGRLDTAENNITSHDHDGSNSAKIEGSNLKSTGVAADKILKADGSDGVTWGDAPTSVDKFTDLSDTPADYSGKAGLVAKVNPTEDGLEFGDAGVATFKDLSDTPADYSGQAGKVPTVKQTEDGLEFNAPIDRFKNLVDTPADYAGHSGEAIVVNDTEDGLEFGRSGGAGGSDVYFLHNLDGSGKITDWSTTGDVTVAEETTTPLNGKKSTKITFGASVAAGDKASLQFTPNERCKNQPFHQVKFVHNYTGDKGLVLVRLVNSGITDPLMEFELDPNASEHRMIMPNYYDQGNQSLEIVAKDGSTANISVVIDDIEVSDEAYGYGSSTISETIEYVGYSSQNSNSRIKFKTKLHDTSDLLIKDDTSVDYTSFVAKKRCTIVASAGLRSGTAPISLRLYVIDENGATTKTSIAISEGKVDTSAPMVAVLDEGWSMFVMNPETGTCGDNAWANFTITATAQSNKNLVQDNREQSHVVASLRLEGNDGRDITAITESIPFDGVSEFWTAGPDGSDGNNGNYYTVQRSDTFIYIRSNIFFTANASRYFALVKNGVYYRQIDAAIEDRGRSITYISYMGEFTEGDKISIAVGANGGTLDNDSKSHYLNIAETYFPPSKESTLPTLLAVNSSEENDYDVDASDAGVLSNPNPVDGWCWLDSVNSDTANGLYVYYLSRDVFSIMPKVWVNVKDGDYYASVIYDYNNFKITFSTKKHDGTRTARPHQIFARKSGADRTPRNTPVVDGKSVIKEKVCNIYPDINNGTRIAQTSSLTYQLNNYEEIGGDVFCSLANDIITLPKGKYIFEPVAGGYDNVGNVSMLIKNEDTGDTIQEFDGFTNTSVKCVNLVPCKCIVEFNDTTNITVWNKQANGDVAYGSQIGIFTIRKLL